MSISRSNPSHTHEPRRDRKPQPAPKDTAAVGAITIEQARSVLAAQPFSVLLQSRLIAFSRNGAVMDVDLREQLKQQHGFAHGGVINYLVDNAITFAAGAIFGPAVVTGGFSIDYLRPATGTMLRATAQTVRAGQNQAVVRCEVFDQDDAEFRLCAVGQGRVMARGSTGAVPVRGQPA